MKLKSFIVRIQSLKLNTPRARPVVKRTGSVPITKTPSIEDVTCFDDVSLASDHSHDLGGRNDTLSSPRVSPIPWLTQDVPDLVVTNRDRGPSPSSIDDIEVHDHFLKVPRGWPLRRKSSGSLQSASDDSDTETSPPIPPVSRRGRRKAICDTKSLGMGADSEISPTNSCDESETNSVTGPSPRGRKRSSGDLGMNYPGDLLVHGRQKKVLIKRNTIADFANTKAYQASTASLISEQGEPKKRQTSSLLLKLMGDKKSSRAKEPTSSIGEILCHIKASEFKDNNLTCYKELHWSELIASKEQDGEHLEVPEHERKRREAVWELFKSECVFLIDHLMVLKHCFMEPLKKVQVEGSLMFTEPQDLFGNLDELCYVSYTFCRDFISLLLKDATATNFGRTEILVMALQRFSQLTRDGEVYHDYCLNYSKAVTYLEQLRKNENFVLFEKWCENDDRCHRLQMTDLLISPMQHCTKVPLLLTNIRKYTEDPEERQLLTEALEKLDSSLKNLETKMKWLKNFERVQEIQQQLVWQPITELEPRAFIPEFLKATLTRQPCERLLASPKRQLLYEGPLTLLEVSKTVNMYMLLFDDILLLTKVRQPPRKISKSALGQDSNPTDGAVFVVHRQPIALDRFTIHDVRPPDAAATGLKNAFVLVQISRFQQIIGVYTLQAPTEAAKAAWMSHLHDAQKQYKAATNRGSTSSGSFSFDSSFISDDVNGDSTFLPGVKPPKLKDSKLKKQKSINKDSDMYNHWNKSLDDTEFVKQVHLDTGDGDKALTKSLTQLNIDDRQDRSPDTVDDLVNNTNGDITQRLSNAMPVSPNVTITTDAFSEPSDSQEGSSYESDFSDLSKLPLSIRQGMPLSRTQRLNLLKVIHEKSHSQADSIDVPEPVYI